MKDICTKIAQCLIVNEDVLCRQATTAAEEARSKNLREVEEGLSALTNH